MSEAGFLTIGKVVSRLKPSYPDLSVSKIRFLEDEGLLTPKRTEGGYRLYSPKDIKRLEAILYLQKNRFLPLSVIKDELDGAEDPDELIHGSTVEETQLVPTDSPETLSKMHPIENIPEMTGISVAFVRQLEEIGAISLTVSPQGRDLVDGADLPLIRTADQLRRYGLEPKVLRPYIMAANREGGILSQALAAYAKRAGADESQRKEYDEALASMISLADSFRNSLVKKIVKASYEQMNG